MGFFNCNSNLKIGQNGFEWDAKIRSTVEVVIYDKSALVEDLVLKDQN